MDRIWRGQMRKLLLHADRNGHFYVLDRDERRVPLGHAVRVCELGQRFRRAKAGRARFPDRIRVPQGSFFVYPTVGGATNFQAPSYSPLTGWFYFQYAEGGQRYVSASEPFERASSTSGARRRWIRSVVRSHPSPAHRPASRRSIRTPEKPCGTRKCFSGSLANGVLATGGQLLFAALRDGNLAALDARTGTFLWRLPDRRQHERVADELRGRRPPIRRDFSRQHAVRLRAAAIDSPAQHPDARRRWLDGCPRRSLSQPGTSLLSRGRHRAARRRRTPDARLNCARASATTRSR